MLNHSCHLWNKTNLIILKICFGIFFLNYFLILFIFLLKSFEYNIFHHDFSSLNTFKILHVLSFKKKKLTNLKSKQKPTKEKNA